MNPTDRPRNCLYRDIERVVVPREEIAARVADLGDRLAREYVGRELTIVAVMTGSLIFLADLVRRLPLRLRLVLIAVCSYPGKSTASQGPRFELPDADWAGQEVLVVDDILDSGQTMAALVEAIRSRGAAGVRTCVLLDKRRNDLPDRREPDYHAFTVDNEFLVGYGLDYDNLYRNLPDICVLRRGEDLP